MPGTVLIQGIDVFLLVFVRMTGLFVIAPIFGRRNIPAYFKIGFSFFSAVVMINTLKMPVLDGYDNLWAYGLLVFKEFMVGITLGYVAYLAFAAIYLAGQIIDMQVGFGMVNVLDPVSNIQVPVTSNFYYIICTLVFLSVNGHHMLVKSLFDSYKVIPLGGGVFSNALLNDMIRVFGNIFITGFKISAPIIGAVLISNVAMGVISKTIPQINVFVVGMPINIVLGFIIMILTIPVFITFVDMIVNGMDSDLVTFMKDMAVK